MMNEITAEEAVKILRFEQEQVEHRLDGCSDTQENRNIYEAFRMAIQALEQQPKPMEKFDDVKTHIQRLAGDYKCWDNRLTWEEALELNRMLEAQPNSNEFFNFDAPMVKKSDAVSREAVIRLVEQYPNIIGNRCSGLISDIKHLPSVHPKYTDEEIDKAQAVEQAYVDKMVELAVEESRKKWLNSFDTSSATKCFEAVNLLKQRLEGEE